MGAKGKNVTFNLPIELIEKYKNYAEQKVIPSMNAGVREALEEYSIKVEKELLKKEMMDASNDPLFIKDLEESMKAFEHSDKEIKEPSEW
ncbi:hypothetical protein L1765_04430 [Microaerobacter geothermalis]|nr:hypothetical protein [Microaerobacter geothermalis]